MEYGQRLSAELITYLSVGIFFAASLALGDYGIRFYVYILQVETPPRIIAGFTEPITTKLVPAITIVFIHQRYDISLVPLQSRPYWFAFIGGLSLGIIERSLYIVVKGASISPTFIVAPWMHALNAVLIAGLIFRSTKSLNSLRFIGQLLVVLVLAMAIHVFWNTLGVVLVYQIFA